MKLNIVIPFVGLASAGLFHLILKQPISLRLHNVIFRRRGSQSCVPGEILRQGHAQPLRPISDEEKLAFGRDRSVILRDVLSEEWVERLQLLMLDAYQHPNFWDVLYSRMVGNFYSAQKSVLLHQTSICGKEIAQSSPTVTIAQQLLDAKEVRSCEPNIALMNYGQPGNTSGTTGWHTDQKYMPVRRTRSDRAHVVRLWIPLLPFTENELIFQMLNDSHAARNEREERALSVGGSDYFMHNKLIKQGADIIDKNLVRPMNYRPGDIIVFTGDAPHLAQGINCSRNSCPRLILSYSGDHAEFTDQHFRAYLPINDNQTVGSNVQGSQFPRVYPSLIPWEWAPFRPTYGEIIATLIDGAKAGTKPFARVSITETLPYLGRVYSAFRLGMWAVPNMAQENDGPAFEKLSLWRHFVSNIVKP